MLRAPNCRRRPRGRRPLHAWQHKLDQLLARRGGECGVGKRRPTMDARECRLREAGARRSRARLAQWHHTAVVDVESHAHVPAPRQLSRRKLLADMRRLGNAVHASTPMHTRMAALPRPADRDCANRWWIKYLTLQEWRHAIRMAQLDDIWRRLCQTAGEQRLAARTFSALRSRVQTVRTATNAWTALSFRLRTAPLLREWARVARMRRQGAALLRRRHDGLLRDKLGTWRDALTLRYAVVHSEERVRRHGVRWLWAARAWAQARGVARRAKRQAAAARRTFLRRRAMRAWVSLCASGLLRAERIADRRRMQSALQRWQRWVQGGLAAHQLADGFRRGRLLRRSFRAIVLTTHDWRRRMRRALALARRLYKLSLARRTLSTLRAAVESAQCSRQLRRQLGRARAAAREVETRRQVELQWASAYQGSGVDERAAAELARSTVDLALRSRLRDPPPRLPPRSAGTALPSPARSAEPLRISALSVPRPARPPRAATPFQQSAPGPDARGADPQPTLPAPDLSTPRARALLEIQRRLLEATSATRQSTGIQT